MNHWQLEIMAELNRQTIEKEIRRIHLEERVLPDQTYRPGWFSRAMFNFANWMISTGKQLRRRYEVPAARGAHQPTGSFAR